MERLIDLHVHTTASDGTLTPRQTAELAKKLGLAAIAVTDHDTAAGLPQALAAGAELGVEVVPGVEVSAGYRDTGVHILGYYIDPTAPVLAAALDWFRQERARRNEAIVQAMAADGYPISMDALRAAFPGAVLGRPHMAALLVQAGCADSVQDALTRWLNKGGTYYQPRRRMPLEQAVQAIRQAGGAACVAHPYQYGFGGAEREAFLRAARDAGCTALEAYYSGYSPAQTQALLEAADRLGMAVAGGSDFHGDRKPHIQMGSGIGGGLAVPYSLLEALRAQL